MKAKAILWDATTDTSWAARSEGYHLFDILKFSGKYELMAIYGTPSRTTYLTLDDAQKAAQSQLDSFVSAITEPEDAQLLSALVRIEELEAKVAEGQGIAY